MKMKIPETLPELLSALTGLPPDEAMERYENNRRAALEARKPRDARYRDAHREQRRRYDRDRRNRLKETP